VCHVVKQFRTEHDFVLPAVLRSVGLPLFQQCRRLQFGRQELLSQKSGPWLALKTFLIVYVVVTKIFRFATLYHYASAQATGLFLAFGIGTAYIITNLRKSKRNRNVVRGEIVAWLQMGL
jgi:hypothetical protein